MGAILRKLLVASAVAAVLAGSTAWAVPKANAGPGRCSWCGCRGFEDGCTHSRCCHCGHPYSAYIGHAAAGTKTTIAQDDPVERRTGVIKETGYSSAEALKWAHVSAQATAEFSGARSYRVLSQSTHKVGDVYVCTMNIEYFVPVHR